MHCSKRGCENTSKIVLDVEYKLVEIVWFIDKFDVYGRVEIRIGHVPIFFFGWKFQARACI